SLFYSIANLCKCFWATTINKNMIIKISFLIQTIVLIPSKPRSVNPPFCLPCSEGGIFCNSTSSNKALAVSLGKIGE
ncbi:hypothetical protein, partial [Aneurinibacillus migulanus]|uniref:hypothetical protein n=1 Tax=Aneurinibacillus migulanus TaxID=47500 RepID=UPI001C3FE671